MFEVGLRSSAVDGKVRPQYLPGASASLTSIPNSAKVLYFIISPKIMASNSLSIFTFGVFNHFGVSNHSATMKFFAFQVDDSITPPQSHLSDPEEESALAQVDAPKETTKIPFRRLG